MDLNSDVGIRNLSAELKRALRPEFYAQLPKVIEAAKAEIKRVLKINIGAQELTQDYREAAIIVFENIVQLEEALEHLEALNKNIQRVKDIPSRQRDRAHAALELERVQERIKARDSRKILVTVADLRPRPMPAAAREPIRGGDVAHKDGDRRIFEPHR